MKTFHPQLRAIFEGFIVDGFTDLMKESMEKIYACCTLGDPTVKQCDDCPCAQPPRMYNSLASHEGEREIAEMKRSKRLHADDPLGEGQPYFKGGYASGGVPKTAAIFESSNDKFDYYAPCVYDPKWHPGLPQNRIPTEASFQITFKPDNEKALIDWIKDFKGMKK